MFAEAPFVIKGCCYVYIFILKQTQPRKSSNDPPTDISNKETYLQDFPEILKYRNVSMVLLMVYES